MATPIESVNKLNDYLQDVPWLDRAYFGNSLYSYFLSLGLFVALSGIFYLIYKYVVMRIAELAVKSSTTGTGALAFFGSLLRQFNTWVLPLVAFYLAMRRLEVPPTVELTVRLMALAAVTLQVVRIGGELLGFVISRTRGRARADDPIVYNTNHNITILLKVCLWIGGALFLLDNMGFNIGTFVAGLGIGGVAIALAAQAILGDTFSSFAIALDKPFEVGDFIVVDALMGNVEYIGLKTTRVRSLSGEMLIFANSDLTKSRIKNFKKMYKRRVAFNVTVIYQTPLAQVARIPDMLRGIIAAQKDVELDRAHFASYSDNGLVFEVVYFVNSGEFNQYMDIQQAVNLQLLELFERENIIFSYAPRAVLTPPDAAKPAPATG